jgi:multidrug efflux pump subunit AcrA (membrane-fusion protein)
MDRDGSGTKSNLEEAQARVDTQKAQVRVNMAQIVQAQMALETAKANLGYTRILAPVDGQVSVLSPKRDRPWSLHRLRQPSWSWRMSIP